MPRARLIQNAALAALGIALCLAFNANAGLLVVAIILGLHCRLLKPQEWRLLIQLTVLGWVMDAVFLRMELLVDTGDISSLSRVLCWPLIASTLCHSLYPAMRQFSTALIVGALWGLLLYGLPLMLGYYQTTLSLTLMLCVAAVVASIILLLFSFIINTRIMPKTV